MTLKNKRGAWINQYVQPNAAVFNARAASLDYVVIKYGLSFYEALANSVGKPWVAELMAEDGAGDQLAYTRPIKYAERLAAQANQPGCIAAIINLEEADGGWHRDNGSGTTNLLSKFRELAPDKPLYASLDTRAGRPELPYQRVCAQSCDGVMPMLYPKAFGQTVPVAFTATLTDLLFVRWMGKEVIPTIQTYDTISSAQVAESGQLAGVLFAASKLAGINAYTLGHATDEQWQAFIANSQWAMGNVVPVPPTLSPVEAMLYLRIKWLEQWISIAQKGTIEEAVALADYWQKLVSK